MVRRGRIGSKAAAGLVVALALACGGEDAKPSSGGEPSASAPGGAAATPAAASADAAAEAAEIFQMRCSTCHGPEGTGDGPGSKGLTPAPRNFKDPAWQAEVSDEHIANIVLYGGAAVGRSPTMPGNPDLTGKPAVVEALVAYVRAIGSE